MNPGDATGGGTRPGARAVVALLVTALVFAAVWSGGGNAQTTPFATPVPVPCGPAISATPVVLTLSTPFVITATATPLPSADESTTRTIANASGQLISCWNTGQWSAYASLLTPAERERRYGSSNPTVAVDFLEGIAALGLNTSIELLEARFARTDGQRLATIEVWWRAGEAITHEQWSFVYQDGGWLMDGAGALELAIQGEAVGIGGTIGPSAFALTRNALAETESIVISLANESPFGRDVWLVSSPVPLSDASFTSGNALGATVHGWRFVPAGQTRELLLQGLPPGDYTLITGLESGRSGAGTAPVLLAALSVSPAPAS